MSYGHGSAIVTAMVHRVVERAFQPTADRIFVLQSVCFLVIIA
jgi:hypothetical protein